MLWIQFFVVAAVIFYAGSQLARYGDMLAEKTGMGRTWIGLVLVAGTTSLPELFTGISSAVQSLPDIAVGDVLGSCMFNLLLLSLMDSRSKAPLIAQAQTGHALAVGLGIVEVGLVGIGIIIDPHLPGSAITGVMTPILVLVYFAAARLLFLFESRRHVVTPEIKEELKYSEVSRRSAIAHYCVASVFVVLGGILLPGLAAGIAESTGLGRALVGNFLVGITTSLPEVVVCLVALRIGAIDLAIGNVLGSNLFNILILGIDDIVYPDGPILGAASDAHLLVIFCVVLMYAIFLTGLTYRATKKRLRLSWDSASILLVYLAALAFMIVFRGRLS